jgi:hypothetical protein
VSTLNVDKVDPSTGTALEIGSSGDTITIPSGATIVNSGTATGFGAALTGSTNNQVTTVTAANAIQGETNLIYNGTILGAGADGANADLGVGLHIKTADSGAGVLAGADELIIEGSGDNGISILTATDATSRICFGDSGGANQGIIDYSHGTDSMAFKTADVERMRIRSDGRIGMGTAGVAGAALKVETAENISPCYFLNTNTTTGATQFNFECMNPSTSSYNLMHISRDGASQVQIQSDGDILNVNNSYGQISDERLKKDIVDANSQWDDIKALRVRNFKFKTSRFEEEDFSQIGVVAQEVEAAGMNGLIEDSLPEPYHVPINSDFGTIEAGTEDNGAEPIEDEDGNITGYEDLFTKGQKVKSLKYSVLYMKAIKALQESMERIEQLEAKVEALENA